jgi:hypothetical protein
VKITSNDSLLLDELYNDLRHEHIEVSKQTTIIKGSMAVDGITVGLIIAGGTLALKNIDTILNLLTFLGKQKNYYIHIKLKDGREMKLNDLSKEKQEQELRGIKGSGEILSIDIGQKK